jgi:hypothetical protein
MELILPASYFFTMLAAVGHDPGRLKVQNELFYIFVFAKE